MKKIAYLWIVLFTASVYGQTQTVGTLCTSEGAAITAEDLAKWMDEFLPPGTPRLVVLTECYGGNAAQAFAGKPNTAVTSATSQGEKAKYGGYDDDASKALKPAAGNNGQKVHDAGTAGKATGETPSTGGGKPAGGVSLEKASSTGAVRGREVVVYAGKPDSAAGRDNTQRDTIKGNFNGEPNTNVTTVGGNGTGGWDKKGSANGLREAIKQAGDRIKASPDPSKEQFILFVTDHGDLHKKDAKVSVVQPMIPTPITSPMGLACFMQPELPPFHLFEDPANITGFSFFVDLNAAGILYDPRNGPFFPPGSWGMTLYTSRGEVVHVDSFFDVWLELSTDGSGIVGDEPGEGVRVIFPIDEPRFVQSFFDVFVEITVENRTPMTWLVSGASQDSGSIAKPVSLRVPQDADGDGDVDLLDFSAFGACFNGPNRPYAGTEPWECARFDTDPDDGDIDLEDFAAFQACFNGPNNPPACE